MAAPARKESSSRERILEGGTEEFAAHGFAGARIDRISRRTKLNVRMIYYHFKSKTGLYRAVLENIYQSMSDVVEKSASQDRGAIEAFNLYSDLLTAQPRFADILVRELLDGAKHLKALWKERPELFERVHARARGTVEAGAKQGYLRNVDAEMTVHIVTLSVCFMMATRNAHPLFLSGRTPSAAELKAQIFDLFLTGLHK